MIAAPPFTVDIQLVSDGCTDAGSDPDGVCEAAHSAYTGAALTRLLESKMGDFKLRLGSQLLGSGLTLRGKPLEPRAHEFAASAYVRPPRTPTMLPLQSRVGHWLVRPLAVVAPHAYSITTSLLSSPSLRRLSALLGSMGFFYGWTTVAPAPNAPAGLVPSRTPLNGLLAVVPSRPFFPRGFLWDEGFHQLVVGGALPEVERESRSSILPSFDGESRSSIARCSRPVAGGRRRSHRIITLCSHHVTAPSFAQHGTRLCPIISSHRG